MGLTTRKTHWTLEVWDKTQVGQGSDWFLAIGDEDALMEG